MSKPQDEFPSEWHFDRHLEDLEREAAGYQRRLLELENLPNCELAKEEAESGLEAARAELRRLGKKPAKRPARAKESR